MNLSEQLRQTAVTYPDKLAYIFDHQAVTYENLDHKVSTFAANLSSEGIQKGDHVALILGNSPEFLIGYYGALRAGAVVIPINPIYTPDEIGYLLHNGDVKAIVTLEQALPLVEKMSHQLPDISLVAYTGTGVEEKTISNTKLKPFTRLVEESGHPVPNVSIEDDDLAVILYTSGTTGQPKGAMLSHLNLFSNASDTGAYLQISSEDVVITALPMFHVFCMTVSMNAPLISGGTILILPKFSPQEVFRVSEKYKATIFAGVPTMYNFLYQYPEGRAEYFQHIRLCISGGSSMPVALLHRFEEKFNVRISEGYGLSEAAPVTTFNPLDRPRKAGSIGMNITNVSNKVVDELGQELPVGTVGELAVKGPNVMKGYYKMPEDTAVTIKEGWLFTGDLAKMDEEGYFYIVDRKKDMVIVGGYNVYPREVEEVLYQHPAIVEAAVVGVPDPNFGEAVQAFVVLKESVTEDEVLKHCSEHLAKYKCPTIVEFIEELPKNTTGKILRKALRKQINV
ncbi:fatty acid--CoA ligase family protein [Pseudalkalibacillus hwajinpoensis]|uniref:Fatty acid--CoA ligase family protein n=1 Tax=Guptibacillus hwajinpoensis TaxID=208199 RepID=A0A4V6WRY3_9BACL|nr:fatty acid--CoA ligase family protein [Pseudalkalibacillus hwajinpoensis]TKD68728.1 fatty acid--CoA ligase family protein [Pseudalkalibacillus hwajinpoensis]